MKLFGVTYGESEPPIRFNAEGAEVFDAESAEQARASSELSRE